MKLLIGIIMLSALMQVTCNEKDQSVRRMGQNVPADIIVIFKPSTTSKQEQEFYEKTIGVQISGIDGFGLMDGIGGMLALPDVCSDQDGVALKLWERVTADQLLLIRNAIDSSPIVDRVVENVRPRDVNCP